MRVKELLSIKGLECFSIMPDQTLLDAAKQMAECKIGALLVMDRGALAGIVTERDIVRSTGKDQVCKNVKIKDVMTTNLIVSKPGDDLDYVMAVMIQNNIRHLPVVEEKTGLVGMLSMRDVVKVLVKNLKAENLYLKDMIGGKLGELGD